MSQRLSIALWSLSSSLERSDRLFCGMLRAFSSAELDSCHLQTSWRSYLYVLTVCSMT
jgi:hypothetical protein